MITAVGSHGDGAGQFITPRGVCVNSVNGKVYVVDSDAHRVLIFNSDLTLSSRSIGGNGQFRYPYDIASDRSGCVYVVDVGNAIVQVFTPGGCYMSQFGGASSGSGELNYPVSICVDSEDRVYVGEHGNHRVSVFTCGGVFIGTFGSQGSGPGQFNWPLGIAVDQCDVVYVSDRDNNTVQIFRSYRFFW